MRYTSIVGIRSFSCCRGVGSRTTLSRGGTGGFVLFIFIGLEIAYQQLDDVVLNTCVGTLLDADAFIAQETEHGRQSQVQFLCKSADFCFRHILLLN